MLLSNWYLSPTSPAFCTGAPRKSCKVSRHWEMFGSSAKAEPMAWKLTLKSMLYSTLLYTVYLVYLCWPMFDLCFVFPAVFQWFFIDLSFCCTKTSGKLGVQVSQNRRKVRKLALCSLVATCAWQKQNMRSVRYGIAWYIRYSCSNIVTSCKIKDRIWESETFTSWRK